MKIQLGDFDINITAKREGLTTKEATESFLNMLSIIYGEAAEYNKSIGCNSSAANLKLESHAIYLYLKARNVYGNKED